jgi:hypothetical protein
MTTTSSTTSAATIPAADLAAAADALSRAGRIQLAMDLLDSATADDEPGRCLLSLAAARAALESDYGRGDDAGSTPAGCGAHGGGSGRKP